MRPLAVVFLLVSAAPLGGCINTDPAVFVTPTINMPTATVTSSVLVAAVTGSFVLDLHLGARASGPSTVTLGEFSILDAEQKTTIVPALTLTGSLANPIEVQPNSDENDDLSFSNEPPTSAMSQLCAKAGVVIGGTIQDSLMNVSTPVTSGVFTVSCP